MTDLVEACARAMIHAASFPNRDFRLNPPHDEEMAIFKGLARAVIPLVLERAAEVARGYADIAIEMAGDTVLVDPCLRGKGFSAENVAASEKLQTDGLIYSSRFHAAQDIMNAILALSPNRSREG